MFYVRNPILTNVHDTGDGKFYALQALKVGKNTRLLDVQVSPMITGINKLDISGVIVFEYSKALRAYMQVTHNTQVVLPFDDKENPEPLIPEAELKNAAIGNYIVTYKVFTAADIPSFPLPAIVPGHLTGHMPGVITAKDAFERDNTGNKTFGWHTQGYIFVLVMLNTKPSTDQIGIAITVEG